MGGTTEVFKFKKTSDYSFGRGSLMGGPANDLKRIPAVVPGGILGDILPSNEHGIPSVVYFKDKIAGVGDVDDFLALQQKLKKLKGEKLFHALLELGTTKLSAFSLTLNSYDAYYLIRKLSVAQLSELLNNLDLKSYCKLITEVVTIHQNHTVELFIVSDDQHRKLMRDLLSTWDNFLFQKLNHKGHAGKLLEVLEGKHLVNLFFRLDRLDRSACVNAMPSSKLSEFLEELYKRGAGIAELSLGDIIMRGSFPGKESIEEFFTSVVPSGEGDVQKFVAAIKGIENPTARRAIAMRAEEYWGINIGKNWLGNWN